MISYANLAQSNNEFGDLTWYFDVQLKEFEYEEWTYAQGSELPVAQFPDDTSVQTWLDANEILFWNAYYGRTREYRDKIIVAPDFLVQSPIMPPTLQEKLDRLNIELNKETKNPVIMAMICADLMQYIFEEVPQLRK